MLAFIDANGSPLFWRSRDEYRQAAALAVPGESARHYRAMIHELIDDPDAVPDAWFAGIPYRRERKRDPTAHPDLVDASRNIFPGTPFAIARDAVLRAVEDDYLSGGCHDLALAAANLVPGSTPLVILLERSVVDPDDLFAADNPVSCYIHAALELPDGRVLDVRGAFPNPTAAASPWIERDPACITWRRADVGTVLRFAGGEEHVHVPSEDLIVDARDLAPLMLDRAGLDPAWEDPRLLPSARPHPVVDTTDPQPGSTGWQDADIVVANVDRDAEGPRGWDLVRAFTLRRMKDLHRASPEIPIRDPLGLHLFEPPGSQPTASRRNGTLNLDHDARVRLGAEVLKGRRRVPVTVNDGPT